MIEITSRLPSDYQEVEYLESTGTQYIDTGVKGKTGLKASGAIMLTASQTCIALGCYSPQRCYMLSFNSNVPRYGYVDWYTAIAAVTVNEKYNFEVSFEKSAQYLKLNGTTVISSANATTFTNNYNMFAFAYSDSGSAGDFAKCRFYSLNLYDNGTLIREFVPCYRKSNNVAGFYDLLNDAFYTNQGTGSFVVGADVGGTVITSGGVILKKFALRRRMMISNSRKKWILTIDGTTNSNYLYATKDGVALAVGTHEMEDGETIHFVAGSPNIGYTNYAFISLNGQTVAQGKYPNAAIYDLVVHDDVIAVGTWNKNIYGSWTLTTI